MSMTSSQLRGSLQFGHCVPPPSFSFSCTHAERQARQKWWPHLDSAFALGNSTSRRQTLQTCAIGVSCLCFSSLWENYKHLLASTMLPFCFCFFPLALCDVLSWFPKHSRALCSIRFLYSFFGIVWERLKYRFMGWLCDRSCFSRLVLTKSSSAQRHNVLLRTYDVYVTYPLNKSDLRMCFYPKFDAIKGCF